MDVYRFQTVSIYLFQLLYVMYYYYDVTSSKSLLLFLSAGWPSPAQPGQLVDLLER